MKFTFKKSEDGWGTGRSMYSVFDGTKFIGSVVGGDKRWLNQADLVASRNPRAPVYKTRQAAAEAIVPLT